MPAAACLRAMISVDNRSRKDDDDGDQEQRRSVGAVEEAPAVRREPRLRSGAGDADGNVRIHAPAAEPLPLRGSAKSLVSSPYCKRRHRVQLISCIMIKIYCVLANAT
jgi:hypothetical protein